MIRRFFRRLFCWHGAWVQSLEPAPLPWLRRYRCMDCGKARDFDALEIPINYIPPR